MENRGLDRAVVTPPVAVQSKPRLADPGGSFKRALMQKIGEVGISANGLIVTLAWTNGLESLTMFYVDMLPSKGLETLLSTDCGLRDFTCMGITKHYRALYPVDEDVRYLDLILESQTGLDDHQPFACTAIFRRH